MNSKNTIFIETTAVVDHSFKGDKHKINKILLGYSKKVSSQYVKMEIKRGVMQYLVYLHNKLTTYKTFQEVIESVQKLSKTQHRHRLGTILEAISSFFKAIVATTPDDIKEKYGDIPIDEYLKREGASYLRIITRKLWNNTDRLANELLNPMDCFLDIKGPYLENAVLINTPRICNKSVIECKIKKYFRDNKEEFQKILDALKALSEQDEETKKRIKHLKEIINLLPHSTRGFSNKQQNHNKCWYCGDAILAVLTPANSAILTSNIKHYDPMCQVLAKKLLTYKGNGETTEKRG